MGENEANIDRITWQMSGLMGRKCVDEIWPEGATKLIIGKVTGEGGCYYGRWGLAIGRRR
jgi:hypothetical protein